jgi:hypothetical protein
VTPSGGATPHVRRSLSAHQTKVSKLPELKRMRHCGNSKPCNGNLERLKLLSCPQSLPFQSSSPLPDRCVLTHRRAGFVASSCMACETVWRQHGDIHINSHCQRESPFATLMTVQKPATRATHCECGDCTALHCRAASASLMKSLRTSPQANEPPWASSTLARRLPPRTHRSSVRAR